jgi:hypothetical protein
MSLEDYLEAEYQLHVNTDKVYREHLKKMEALTKRQVFAQEPLISQLAKLLTKLDKEIKASRLDAEGGE